jgi:predicted alpha/beta superfamily hydrolase
MKMKYCLSGIALALAIAASPATAQVKPCISTVVGHLEIVPLVSRVFHNSRQLRVWLPPGYGDAANAERKYPVLYVLDGASAFDACTAFRNEELSLDEVLTQLIASGKIPPVIAVGIDNGSDAAGHPNDMMGDRAREYLVYPDPADPDTPRVHGDQMPAFLEQDVIPAIAAKFRTLGGPSHSALWGSSYGGAAAFSIALRRPRLFDSVIIESPALQIGNGQLMRDSTSLVILPKRVALGAGAAESPLDPAISARFVLDMKLLAANLKAAVFPSEVQLTITEGSHHTAVDIGKRLPADLLFIYGPSPSK